VNNRLAEHFVYTKDILVVPFDDIPFVVQTITCGFQTLIENSVDDEIQYIDHFSKMENSFRVNKVVYRNVAFTVALNIERIVSSEERFWFIKLK